MACEQEAVDLALAEADLVLAEIDVAIDTINLQLSWDAYYAAYSAVMTATYNLWLCQNGSSLNRTAEAPFALTTRRAMIEIMRSGNVPPVKTQALLALRRDCVAHRNSLKAPPMTTAQHAEAIASKVDANKVGFDPATIITILQTVLPLIVSCFQRNDQSDPDQVSATVRAAHERNPEALRRRTARRIRAESEEPMSKAASFELADATIAHALETPAESVAAYCRNPA